MYNKWDSPQLDVLIAKILEAGLKDNKLLGILTHARIWTKSRIFNLQNRKYAPDLSETHYNAGNHLFKSFLDPNMIYTCAYFKNTNDLTQAQLNKIKIIGKKLNLQPGEKVLDIGCGWGGTARIISEMFDVQVTAVSDSTEMIRYAKAHNADERIKFINTDYRNIRGKFNKIYNVGFLEAVGPKNYRTFMEQVNELLLDNGIFLTHTIIGKYSVNVGDPWLDKYIFPHGVLPSKKQIEKAIINLFDIRDLEAFGNYYETTLMHWSNNLNRNWESIKNQFENPVVFKRMMDFYLLSCKAAFHTKMIDLCQYVFTKRDKVKEYKRYRLP
jgi:cyclopropane-fatty-acyl-phospholipid synthase